MEILDRIHGHVAALNVGVTVRDMSLNGMSLETTFAFPEGAVHEFGLTLGDGTAAVLRGRIIRCREHIAADGTRSFVSGVQFVDDDPPGATAGNLLDKIR